jgi:hypothetical protein
MGCIDFSLFDKISSFKLDFNIDIDSLFNFDLDALDAAKFNGILDIPMGLKSIQDSVEFLSSFTSGSLAAVKDYLQQELVDRTLTDSGLLALMSTIITAGTQLELVGAGFIVEELKKQLYIRSIIYTSIDRHLANLFIVLRNYAMENRVNLHNVRQALKSVIQAEQALRKVQQSTVYNNSSMVLQYHKINSSFTFADQAIKYLAADGSIGSDFFSVLRSKYGNSGVKEFLQGSFNRAVLGKSIDSLVKVEASVASITEMLPVPFLNVGATIDKLNSSLEKSLAGYVKTTFNKTAYDVEEERLKKIDCGRAGIEYINLKKGLIPTHVLIKQLCNQLLIYHSDWDNLQKISRSFIVGLDPAINLLTQVHGEMENAIRGNDSEIILAGKTAGWIAQLSTLDILRNAISAGTAGLQNTAFDMSALETAQAKILKAQTAGDDERFIGILIGSLPRLAQAPFSKRGLRESLALTSILRRALNKTLNSDMDLLATLNQYNIKDNPLYTTFSSLISAMENMPPPVNMVANAFRTGQLGGVVHSLKTLYNNKDKIASFLESMGECLKSLPKAMDGEQMLMINYDKAKYQDTKSIAMPKLSLT